jgi:hypothetical protein
MALCPPQMTRNCHSWCSARHTPLKFRTTTTVRNFRQVYGRKDREARFGSDPGVVTTMLYSADCGAGGLHPNDVAVVHMWRCYTLVYVIDVG